MMRHSDIIKSELTRKIKSGAITLAGNARLKIYGSLNCKSGKRMHIRNRVFFANEKEAIQSGYRPCGNCMVVAFHKWLSKF
ncbi:MAG TPA: metal-binding protein [Cytophagales bacterium]|nr:metal-binding protein [Cytophagales bacterium]HCR53784.1 metal-binding protein [Cytophagales bacterium]